MSRGLTISVLNTSLSLRLDFGSGLQSPEVDTGNILEERLALGLGNLELDRSNLALVIRSLKGKVSLRSPALRSEDVTYGVSTSTPRATTVNFLEV